MIDMPEKAREFGVLPFELLGLVYEIYTKPKLHSERPFDAARNGLILVRRRRIS